MYWKLIKFTVSAHSFCRFVGINSLAISTLQRTFLKKERFALRNHFNIHAGATQVPSHFHSLPLSTFSSSKPANLLVSRLPTFLRRIVAVHLYNTVFLIPSPGFSSEFEQTGFKNYNLRLSKTISIGSVVLNREFPIKEMWLALLFSIGKETNWEWNMLYNDFGSVCSLRFISKQNCNWSPKQNKKEEYFFFQYQASS